MAALMTTDMGNADKIVGYFTECRDLGIKVLGPDVNESQKNFAVVDGAIRFGLAAIKNVGEGAVESVLAIRTDSGPFTSFFDFCRRVDLHKVNKRMLEGLIKTGAFDSTGREALSIDGDARSSRRGRRGRAAGTRAGPDQYLRRGAERRRSTTVHLADAALPNVPEWDQAQRLKYERELTGFYITAHPLTRYEATHPGACHGHDRRPHGTVRR